MDHTTGLTHGFCHVHDHWLPNLRLEERRVKVYSVTGG